MGLYLILINAVTFVIYAVDKMQAKKDAWRISERTLLLFAAAGGSIGALLGMYVFRHKTRKPKFKYGIPLILLAQIAIVYCI